MPANLSALPNADTSPPVAATSAQPPAPTTRLRPRPRRRQSERRCMPSCSGTTLPTSSGRIFEVRQAIDRSSRREHRAAVLLQPCEQQNKKEPYPASPGSPEPTNVRPVSPGKNGKEITTGRNRTRAVAELPFELALSSSNSRVADFRRPTLSVH